MIKPNVLVFSGYGLNCEEETKQAFILSGAKAEIIHINDIIDETYKLSNYQILAFPGGFSYGDDTGSGNAYANRVRNHLWEQVQKFIQKDTLVIGICNGFQIIVNLGLVPALSKKYGERQVALMANDSARYSNRWVDLKVENDTPWLKGITEFSTPIAHGEGKFYAKPEVLAELKNKGLIALRYTKGDMYEYQHLPYNPNGALDDIAGITDETKRILGLMPHPERGMFFTQRPDWPLLKEEYKRTGKQIPEFSDGLKVFKNGVEYFK